MQFKDYYSILNISEEATSGEIKSAYRLRARQLHPDVNRTVDTTPEMQELNEAYMVLSNPETRMQYDRERSRYRSLATNYESTAKQQSDYQIFDEDLAQKIQEAARKARVMTGQFFDETKGLLVVGGKEAVSSFFTACVCAGGFFLLLLISAQCSR